MKATDANRPLRVFDKVLKGGLGSGNLGVVMARHGMGKIAVLTSIGLDHAMDGRNTLHVALGETVSDIRAYHDEILNELIGSLNPPNRAELLTQVERHKQIYTYRDTSFSVERLQETLRMLADYAEFRPHLIELQGWPDFNEVQASELAQLKEIATEHKCEIWLAAHTTRQDGEALSTVPDYIARFDDLISVFVALDAEGEHVRIHVLKAHGTAPTESVHLELDPTTMLIRWR